MRHCIPRLKSVAISKTGCPWLSVVEGFDTYGYSCMPRVIFSHFVESCPLKLWLDKDIVRVHTWGSSIGGMRDYAIASKWEGKNLLDIFATDQ